MSVHSGMILLNIFGVRLKGRISSGFTGHFSNNIYHRKKIWLTTQNFFSDGKVNGKIMFTGVSEFSKVFFSIF